MAALPETPGERIADLCNVNHITQKELAKRIGVSAPQMSRIVSGKTKTVSSDILIAVANEFKVSTDFILGLTDISVRKNYEISELGLSEKAVKGLVTGAIDVEILNRLLEHKHFPYLTNLIRIYFEDTAKRGVVSRNQIIEMATSSLSDLTRNRALRAFCIAIARCRAAANWAGIQIFLLYRKQAVSYKVKTTRRTEWMGEKICSL